MKSNMSVFNGLRTGLLEERDFPIDVSVIGQEKFVV